jgi:CRP/FNR family transcriptional regulator, cyclic AMP receptor protein
MSNPEFAALAHELREAAHVYAADGDAAARYGAAYMALMDARPRDLADMACGGIPASGSSGSSMMICEITLPGRNRQGRAAAHQDYLVFASSVRQFTQTATDSVLQTSPGGPPMTLPKDVEVLRNIPLFAKVEPAKLKLLALTSERLEYLSGDELFHQGDYGDAAYIILDGKADILVDSPKGAIKVATLGKNIIGEIAILCDVPRTATVVAHGDLETPARVEGWVLPPGHPVSAGWHRSDDRTRHEAASDHPVADCGARAAAR